jgi:hypothetical protein
MQTDNEDRAKSLNVAALIAVLQTYDQTMPVVLEGCDCEGYLGGIRVTHVYGEKVAYLDRTDTQ